MIFNTFFLFLALQVLNAGLISGEKKNVYIAAFYPDSSVISAPSFPYTSLYTEELINNNSLGLLRDFNFKVEWKNTLCREQYAMKSFINFLRDESKQYLSVFGPACSDPAAGIAQISHFFGLPLFTYTARSPALGNTKIYPKFIRGNPSGVNIVVGWIKFIKDYNWKRLAIINQQGDYFLSTSQEAQIILKKLEIEHYVDIFDPQSIRFEEQVETILMNLDTRGYRVVIVNAYPNTVVKILCKLKKYPSLYPPLTTWFYYGWFGNTWYGDPMKATNGECNVQDIQLLTEGALAVNSIPRSAELFNSTTKTISGRTPGEIYEDYREWVGRVKSPEFFEKHFRIEELYLYDGLWALALALNKTIEQGFDLTRVNYTADSDYLKAFYDNVIGLDFQGWSGRMSFVGNERYDGRIQVLEFVNASLQFRGHLRNIPRNPSGFANTSGIWYDQDVPYTSWRPELASDGIVMHPIHASIFPLVLILSIAACVYVTGIVVTLLVGWYKRMRPVTTSEPAITVTILSGTYFLFLLAVLLPVDGGFLGAGTGYVGGVIFCQTRYWLLAVSISIIFGAMLGKAAKFYIIVIKQRFDYSDHLRPVYLLLFPLVLVLLDTAYFLVWLFVSPQVLRTHEIASGVQNPPRYIVTECVAQNDTGNQVFLWLLIASKSLLVLVGLFLAYNLRKVTHKSLRYTGTITWTMYNTSIFSLGIVLVLLLVASLEIRYSLSALLSLAEGVIAATIVSGPILYYLVKDPKGEKLMESGATTSFPESIQMLEMRIESLLNENNRLKSQNKETEKSILDNTTLVKSLDTGDSDVVLKSIN